MPSSEQHGDRTVQEDQSCSPDELLDWLCWVWATEGERFYPPDETAEECIEVHDMAGEVDEGWERGQHARAWATAVGRFQELEKRGYDPKARAEREIENSREQGLDLEDIDWSWYDDV